MLFLKIFILVPITIVGTGVVRSFFPLLLFLGMLIIKLELHIFRIPPKRIDFKVILLYRELCIVFKILRSFLSFFLIVFLGANLIGLVITINGSIIGWKFLPWNFYLLNPLTMLTLLVYLELLFKGGCLFYLISYSMLRRWKMCCGGIYPNLLGNPCYSRYYKKVLCSLQPLKIPVGHFVSIDLSFKVIYLDFVQGRVMESIIAFQAWISSRFN